MSGPKCKHCGNDGTQGDLYIAVDAKWVPERGTWLLERRDGEEVDCLACDGRTYEEVESFPYYKEISA